MEIPDHVLQQIIYYPFGPEPDFIYDHDAMKHWVGLVYGTAVSFTVRAKLAISDEQVARFRTAQWVHTLITTAVGNAVTRQWAAEQVGDQDAAAKALELTRGELEQTVSGLIERRPAAELTLSLPPGSHWEWTGAGWILVIPGDGGRIPDPGPEPEPDWGAADVLVAGFRLRSAATTVAGKDLGEMFAAYGARLVEAAAAELDA